MFKLIDTGFEARLQRLSSRTVRAEMGEELHQGAVDIAEDAAESIRADSISGPGHKPSPPGSPPNADTHVLDESLHATDVVDVPEGIQTSAVADAPYALFQEMGAHSINLPERPFLRPAMIRGRPKVIAALARRFQQIVRSK